MINSLKRLFERIAHMFDADKFNAEITQIATDHQAQDPAALAGKVNDAVATAITPVTDRLAVVEKALADLADAATAGDIPAVQAVIADVPPAPPAAAV